MPRYRVKLSDGRTVVVEAAQPPSEQDVLAAIGQPPQAEAPAAPEVKSGPNWDIAPMLGGMAGGIGGFLLGGPIGALAGAGIGGALGGGAKGYAQSDETGGRLITDVALEGLKGGATQAAGEAVGQVPGMAMRRLAPALMEQPLQRTAQQRLDFPNTPRRLVNEGILPKEQNIQRVLTQAEEAVGRAASNFDAQRPQVAGYLPPAKEAIPLGRAPRPRGGQPSLEDAEVAMLRPPAGVYDPIYSGEMQGGAQADVVRGPGVMLRDMPNAAGAGAPPTMVDPAKIARQARGFAHGEGRVGGLGDTPGPESQELDRLTRQYLQQNQRPHTVAETIDQKRAYQARARYDNRPNAPTQTGNELNFNKGIAAGNRAEAIRLVPELEPLLAREQDLIGGVQAAQGAAAKHTPLSMLGMGKAAIGLRSPTLAGVGAILSDRLGRSVAPFLPSIVRGLLLSQMAEEP